MNASVAYPALILTIPYAPIFLGVSLVAFYPDLRRTAKASSQKTEGDADRGSFELLTGCILICVFFNITIFLLDAFKLSPDFALPFFWTGIFCIVVGALIRWHCFKVLADYFQFKVSVLSTQPIIRRGLYRWIRHPSYVGTFMMYVGLTFCFGSWVSPGVAVIVLTFGIGYRVRSEEAELDRVLGAEYQQYKKATRRFIPFVL